MKKLAVILPLILTLLGLGCDKEETPPVIEMPTIENPVINNPPVEDETNYVILGGTVNHWQTSTIQSSDGNIIIVGDKRTGSNYNMIVTKTNTLGEVIFTTSFHQQDSKAISVDEDSQSNIYVSGYVFGENFSDESRLAIAKLDKDGIVLWEKIYHEEKRMQGINIAVINDDEIIVNGYTSDEYDLVFLKVDSLGTEQSFKIIEASQDSYRVPSNMLVLQDSNLLITDYDNGNFNLTWYDREFNMLWGKSYGEGHRVCRSAIQLEDGSIIVVGKKIHREELVSVTDSSKVLVIKTDSNGELIWEKEAGDTDYLNDGQSIAVNQDGSFVVNGYALRGQPLDTEHMIIYIDENGDEINSKYFSDDSTFRGANIIKIENDRNIMTGGYKESRTYFLNVDNYGN